MMRRNALAGIALLWVGNCAFEPPDGSVQFTPPAHYREIWKQAEACTGETGNFDRVHWYMVPGKSFHGSGGVEAIGHWNTPHDILIAEEWLTTDWVIRHEMIHDLTGLSHYAGDWRLWGLACHATWGYLESDDPNYKP